MPCLLSRSIAVALAGTFVCGLGMATASAVTPTPTPTARSVDTGADAAFAAFGDGGSICGTKPLPDCPLQGWMKTHLAPAVTAKDFAALGDHLTTLASFAPEGYKNWSSIARDGADAAKAQNLPAVKAACVGCHEPFKATYRAELRTRPLP